MTSYKIVPVPSDGIETGNIQNALEDLSALESEAELRSGTVPDSLQRTRDGVCWFEYAKETVDEYDTLDGTSERIIPERYAVVLLGNGYIAVEKCTRDIEREIVSAISNKFTDGFSLSPVEFKEKTLRKVLDQSDNILGLDVAPKRAGKPDRVSGRDTSLAETDFLDEHGVDPFEKVKVELPGKDIDINVSFDRKGNVVLHTRTMPMRRQVRVLRYIADKIVDRYRDQTSFQRTLPGGT